MDFLKAEIARKRKQLEDSNIIVEHKKYFKRSDLLAKEKEEYINNNISEHQSSKTEQTNLNSNDSSSSFKTELKILSRSEVIRKLRERRQPILLFGETEEQAFHRLRQSEISEPEINRGLRNDFQAAMEQVDQAILDEMVESNFFNNTKHSHPEDYLSEESTTYEDIQKMAENLGTGNRECDMIVIMTLLQFLMKQWYLQLEKSKIKNLTTKEKIARATFNQTRDYLRPLLRKLKSKSLPDDICDSLCEITRHLLDRNYIMASDAYLQMAIGNAPWPIGVTMVGIHARTGREKIFSKNVAHVMNDETQRKYIQGLKRLMTKCQEYYPTDPSRCVEYAK
ncbi:pre-mRNA-splicing factor 18 [Ctenocephalides felis]|uniref:pre-mRNA-splicing factor 18 n=1 Tax=Ctenocephalides felis TaxID=7515 RepID=UPI000E6E4149|nr:pre-mRNA-splicing factor 18 [Ctenocephalides felis]